MFLQAVTVLASVASAFLLVTSLDRSRGRRRCPRCRYRIESWPADRCSECGKVLRSERSLLRPRLRRRRLILATLALAVGASAMFGRRAQEHGWVKATPSLAYVLAWRFLDESRYEELSTRIVWGELRGFEQRLLIRQCVAAIANEDDPRDRRRAIDLLRSAERSARVSGLFTPWRTTIVPSALVADTVTPLLIDLVERRDPVLARPALSCLQSMEADLTPLFLDYLPELRSDRPYSVLAHEIVDSIRPEAIRMMGTLDFSEFGEYRASEREFLAGVEDCRGDRDRVAEHFESNLCSDDADIVRLSLFGLLALEQFDRATSAVESLVHHDDETVRSDAMAAVAWIPLSEATRRLIEIGLDDERLWVQSRALRAAAIQSCQGVEFPDNIDEILRSQPEATDDYVSVGGSPDLAALVNVRLRQGHYPTGWEALNLQAIARLEFESAEVFESLREYAEAADAELRSAAAYALAMHGIEQSMATSIIIDAARITAYFRSPRSPSSGSAASTANLGTFVFEGPDWYANQLAEHGACDIDQVVGLLDDDVPRMRRWAARVLGHDRDASDEIVRKLRRMARRDPDPGVAHEASEAIERIRWSRRD